MPDITYTAEDWAFVPGHGLVWNGVGPAPSYPDAPLPLSTPLTNVQLPDSWTPPADAPAPVSAPTAVSPPAVSSPTPSPSSTETPAGSTGAKS